MFAWYDYLKREVPDVFFFQGDPNYPINFAAQVFPPPSVPNPLMTPNNGYAFYVLPLGNTMVNNPPNNSYGDGNMSSPSYGFTGLGIFGASYPSAAGLFKNMPGIGPLGFDGLDNNQNNLIDEIGEGGWNLTLVEANHTHATARSEMLYAILVEGSGPLGSVFSKDDFTDREVQDTDNDGLPEFVDAWGQPLQFFRWPILYHSDLQRGQVILPNPNMTTGGNAYNLLPPYQTYDSNVAGANNGAVFQERDRDPLDPNQQMTAPQWWSQTGVGGQLAANNSSPFAGNWPQAAALGASGGVEAFEYFFHRLTEPCVPGTGVVFWDRGGSPNGYARRSFYTKFLILSGGRDKLPGVFLYADADMRQLGAGAAPYLLANENNALPFGLDVFGGGNGVNLTGFLGSAQYPTGASGTPGFPNVSSNDPLHPSSWDIQEAAKDDISNHNISSAGAIGGSG